MTHSSPRLALGIHFGHDAAVAVCSPEGLLFSLAEERVSRIKHHFGFPRRAVETALTYCGLSGREFDIVAFSTSQTLFPNRPGSWIVDADGDRQPAAEEPGGAQRLAKMRDKVRRKWSEFADRHWCEHVDFMRDVGILDDGVAHYHVAHHRAHAASAFRLSGVSAPVTVLTCDGKGDGLSATIYRGEPGGRLVFARRSAARDSLGMFYQAITETLGFVPVDGEYKTMGLAAFGGAAGRPNPFGGLLSVRNGILSSSKEWKAASYNERHPDRKVQNPLSSVVQADEFREQLRDMRDCDIAYFAQAHFEEVMLRLVADAMAITGARDLAAAGGVMLNVKANALIRDRLQPPSFFVFPDSADSGLAAGAALEALHQHGLLAHPLRFDNPYLGHEFGDAAIEREIREWAGRHGLAVTPTTPGDVADRVAEGKVIGVFQGRLEVGPRALGNRSVVADPRRLDVKDRINQLLKGREPFVPFAPSVLEEDARLYWDGPVDYRFMTFAVRASERAKRDVPAVVHVDGTLRPQVVCADVNPRYAELIRAFKRHTGVGVLLNTSFNRHGHPIVGSPADALLHLVNGWVEGLYIGSYFVELGHERAG